MSHFSKHPKGLYVLASTEMWERFNFYGMRAIFALFISECLGFSTAYSAKVVGGFLGLSYLSSLLGGYLADNRWGNKKCLIIGALSMSVGQFFLFSSASCFHSELSLATKLMWVGLVFIILGVGLFKPNISGMVGMLYKDRDTRLDTAYTIFYMGINTGAFLGMSICSLLGDVKDAQGLRDLSTFKWGFLAAAIAILLSIIVYLLFHQKYLLNPYTQKTLGILPNQYTQYPRTTSTKLDTKNVFNTTLIGCVLWVVFYFLLQNKEAGQIDFFAVVYGFIYSLGIALVLAIFSDKSLTKSEKNNVLIIIICSFFVIFFWAAYEQASTSLTYIADKQTNTAIAGYVLPPSLIQNANSIFVILLSPLIAWLWNLLQKHKREPNSYHKLALGIFMLSLGYFIIAQAVKDLGHGGKMNVIWLFILYFFHTTGELFLSPVGLSIVYQLAPKRLLSMVMGIWFLANAAGYSLSGTLGALLPPSPDKFEKARHLGLDVDWILSHPSEPLSASVLQILKDLRIPRQYPSLMGISIHNLYEFFICFVILSLGASILLFVLNRFLRSLEYKDVLSGDKEGF